MWPLHGSVATGFWPAMPECVLKVRGRMTLVLTDDKPSGDKILIIALFIQLYISEAPCDLQLRDHFVTPSHSGLSWQAICLGFGDFLGEISEAALTVYEYRYAALSFLRISNRWWTDLHCSFLLVNEITYGWFLLHNYLKNFIIKKFRKTMCASHTCRMFAFRRTDAF